MKTNLVVLGRPTRSQQNKGMMKERGQSERANRHASVRSCLSLILLVRHEWLTYPGTRLTPFSKNIRPPICPCPFRSLFPPVRIGLKHNPPLRNKAYAVGVLTALAHAGYIMSQDSSV